jgi:hypothetical protein
MHIRTVILDEAWWAWVELFLSILEPLVDLLHLCDTYVPILGDVYESMNRCWKNEQVLEEQNPLLYCTVKDIIISSWKLEQIQYPIAFFGLQLEAKAI